jgi:hypothetical protein
MLDFKPSAPAAVLLLTLAITLMPVSGRFSAGRDFERADHCKDLPAGCKERIPIAPPDWSGAVYSLQHKVHDFTERGTTGSIPK